MYERMVGQGRLEPTLRLVIVAASARWRSDGYVAGAMFERAMRGGPRSGPGPIVRMIRLLDLAGNGTHKGRRIM